MAMVEGTNFGMVTAAPVDDPAGAGTAAAVDARTRGFKLVAGSDGSITSMGWWCDTASEEVNFQLGIYSHDAVNDRPEDRLAYSGDVAKGTTAGWKTASVSYNFTSGTTYWLMLQCDDPATTTYTDTAGIAGARTVYYTSQTALQANYDAPSGTGTTNEYAIYALYETEAGGTGMQINIGDAWKSIDAMQINIGDAWKAVAGAQINIGDAWKTVF